jgi:hypothetical protein
VRHKQLVHQLIALLANGGTRGGSGMGSDDQAYMRPRRSESNIRAIVKRAIRSTFRMSPLCIWWVSENCFDFWQIQERIVLAPGDHPETRSEHVGQRGRIAIQSRKRAPACGHGQEPGESRNC